MKKIKGFVKKNYKVVIGIIIGITISIGIGVSAVATKDITYDNSTSGLTSTNLQGAIDELNTKATTKIEEAKKECPEGYICLGFVPTYFAYGTPTTASTTDYTTLGKNVFAGLGSDETTGGVCINDGGLFCIKRNDYDNSVAALKAHFGESSCADRGFSVSCYSGAVGCRADSDGAVRCSVTSSNEDCVAGADGSFDCF